MGFVYIFQSGEEHLFKIGKTTKSVEERRKELATGNPKQLTIFDVFETPEHSLGERFLHKKFQHCRITGIDATEYFKIEPDALRAGISEVKLFLDEFIPIYEEAKQYSETETNGKLKPADREALALYQQLSEVRAQIDLLDFKKQLLESKLKRTIGNHDGIEGIATWKTMHIQRFDQTTFKKQHPEIWTAFVKTQISRRFMLK